MLMGRTPCGITRECGHVTEDDDFSLNHECNTCNLDITDVAKKASYSGANVAVSKIAANSIGKVKSGAVADEIPTESAPKIQGFYF
uniref:Uncharacterized protein n=1 Tax=Romanomermis culicivorax TaxID=13658 RepID=A0A915I3Y7_ROMCU